MKRLLAIVCFTGAVFTLTATEAPQDTDVKVKVQKDKKPPKEVVKKDKLIKHPPLKARPESLSDYTATFIFKSKADDRAESYQCILGFDDDCKGIFNAEKMKVEWRGYMGFNERLQTIDVHYAFARYQQVNEMNCSGSYRYNPEATVRTICETPAAGVYLKLTENPRAK